MPEINAASGSHSALLSTIGPAKGEVRQVFSKLPANRAPPGISSSALLRQVHFGPGLALWVVREILNKHGGRIHVRSRVGRGTAVSLLVPMSQNPSVSASLQAIDVQWLRDAKHAFQD